MDLNMFKCLFYFIESIIIVDAQNGHIWEMAAPSSWDLRLSDIALVLFSRAAVTKYHKLCGFKATKAYYIVLKARRLK